MAALSSFSLLRNSVNSSIVTGLGSVKAASSYLVRQSRNPLPQSRPLPLHLRGSLYLVSATNDEEASAKAAAANADTGAPTIFDQIIAKEIPSSKVYEDDNVFAFRDISPQAPVHVLVIPKLRDCLTQLGKGRHVEISGQLMYAAKIVAEKEGILDGFRVVINSGPAACQSVYHLHLHVIGGRQMKWPRVEDGFILSDIILMCSFWPSISFFYMIETLFGYPALGKNWFSLSAFSTEPKTLLQRTLFSWGHHLPSLIL